MYVPPWFRRSATRLTPAALLLALALPAADSIPPTRPFLHPLFSDNMVLQRDQPLPVWGWTTPGAGVTVTLNRHSAQAQADPDGQWKVRLPRQAAGGPFELRILGAQSVTLTNVLIGDVWLCSGQSNMEMGVGEVNNAAQEIAQAKFENIRLFTVPKHIATEPQPLLESRWKLCTPETIVQGDYNGFTAAGYFFGRALHQELGVPIGLIDSSWGGTVAEAWTSAEALAQIEDFRPALEQVREMVEQRKRGTLDWNATMAQWYAASDPGSSGSTWANPDLDTDPWPTMNLPQNWEAGGLADFDGIVWFRKTFDLPADESTGDAHLSLGPIDDRDTTWLNGVKLGGLDTWNTPRDYRVPPGVLKPGRNVLAVRVLDTGGGGGFAGQPDQLHLRQTIGNTDRSLDLSGPWRYRQGPALASLAPAPQPLDNNPNVVTVLYNGMIAPLLPFAIKGAIWYQGESNAGRAAQYQQLLPTMIQDWRTRFDVGPFPFLIVQLANFMATDPEPVESDWAALREAQWLTTRRVPNTGLALAIDIGEANDIHPRNKQEVGRRLSLAARAIAYGQDLPYSGPTYRAMRADGNRIRIEFDHTQGGLTTPNNTPLRGFAIAGADRRFVWAAAQVDGDTVVVSSPTVSQPTAVRYAWANNPVANLYNGAGLPAVPFRTDAPQP